MGFLRLLSEQVWIVYMAKCGFMVLLGRALTKYSGNLASPFKEIPPYQQYLKVSLKGWDS